MAKKDPKKPSVLLSASSVLQGLLGNVQSPLSEPFTRWKLWRYWEEIVGESLAQMSVPVEFHRGRLVIWAKSSAQLQDLHFMAETIKLAVNKFLARPAVHSIRFTLDEKRVPPADALPRELDLK